MVKKMTEIKQLFCGDCKATFEFKEGKRGSTFLEIFLWSTLIIPGFFYSLWRKPKTKKFCDYCGSSFLLPDCQESREMLKPVKKNNNSHF
jgi:hypothetical protein